MTDEVREPDSGSSFAAAFHRALLASEWNLSSLAAELTRRGHPVTAATLSYWQGGLRRPGRRGSTDVVREIEEILQLESGCLLAHVRAPRLRGGGGRYRGLTASMDVYAERIAHMLAALGMPDEQAHRLVLVHEELRFDHHGSRRIERSRILYRAETGDVDSVFLGFADVDAADGPGQITMLSMGRVGSYVIDRELRILALRIDLPRTFTRGETFLLTLHLEFPDAYGPLSSHQRWFQRVMREHAVVLHFHPDQVPEQVQAFRSSSTQVHDLPAGKRPRTVPIINLVAQSVQLDLAPGTSGLQWRFKGQDWHNPEEMDLEEHQDVLEAWQTWQGPQVWGSDAQEIVLPPRSLH